MPLYEYKCDKGHYFTKRLPVKQYKEPQTCECGSASNKLLSAPMIAPQFESYESPVTGKPINTKKAREEDLKKSGCVPYETGMVEQNNKKLRNDELKLENAMDRTVDEQISKMDSRQQEKLLQSVAASGEVEYSRTKSD